MHDMLEEVCKFDLGLLLKNMIYEFKYFSIDILLNNWITTFDYTVVNLTVVTRLSDLALYITPLISIT